MSDETQTGDETRTHSGDDYDYETWVESIKHRSPQSWDFLIDSFADDLRRDIQASLQTSGLPVTMAEDISQETWLTAFQNIHTFVWQDEERFYHWLRVISCNHIHRARRQQHREISVDENEGANDELDSFFETYHLQQKSVEDEVIAGEQMLALVQALETLKPEEREILVRWLMGETPRALATDYQKPPRTVSIIVLRAKRKVEARLDYIQAKRKLRGVSNDNSQ